MILEFRLSKVGFPIRKSMDQSLFAAPHSLSQRSTSFIASHCQGIHRIPLRHLIALIINIHTLGRVCCRLLSASNELDTPNPHARLSPRALPAAGYDLERPVCFVRSNRQRGGQASLERMFEHGSDAGKAFVQTVLEITQ
jgi:hypothetical protein